MLDPRWRRLARVRFFCDGVCIAAITAGCLVLCGWIFHAESLKSGLLHSFAIKANLSIGLILLGVSLWLLLPDPPRTANRRVGLILGGLATSIGGATALEYVLRSDLRIDQLLFRDYGAGEPYAAGRMSPVMATTLLALGLALLLLDWETRRGRRPAQTLCLWGAFVGVMSLSGYINGAAPVYRLFSYSLADVATAQILFVMSAAIFFARPRAGLAGDLTGRFVGSAMARRFLPAVILIPLFAAWLRMRLQRDGLYGTELGLALNVTVNVLTLSLLVWLNARELNETEASLEQEREAKNMLYDASLKDELTGLYNRRGFLFFAEEQLKLASSGRRELHVIFADLDGLKAINDGFGHAEGDRALRRAAQVLQTVFRDTDLIARFGGDEFAVLALDCSPAGLVRINAHLEKALRNINEPGNPWKLSISLGAVHVDAKHQLSIDELLSTADAVMYKGKREKSRHRKSEADGVLAR